MLNDISLREVYKIEISLECFNEDELSEITDGFIAHLDQLDQTHWAMKVDRDLDKEQALKDFRNSKAEILAELPDEFVQEYYANGGTMPGHEIEKLERHLTVVPDLEDDEEEDDA